MQSRWKAEPRNAVTALVKQASAWWKTLNYPTFGDSFSTNPSNWLGVALFKAALDGGPTVKSASWEGNLLIPPESLMSAITQIAGTRLLKVDDHGNSNGSFILASEETMISISLCSSGMEGSVTLATVNNDVCQKLSTLFNRVFIADNPAEGLVFSLAHGMGGYSIARVGLAGTPLQRGNYAPQVLADYDHVVKEQATESPCGRLVILSGSPGTGKTFLVRSLLSDAPKTAYVLIPPNLIESIGSPEILPALTQAKREFEGPIMLIIEDADHALVQRGEKNMNAISSMLNLGDGILGSILDVRILATTNAEKLQMDPATQRPGRLCRHIEVGLLPSANATAALSRLLGKSVRPFTEPTSLAQVYASARAQGWMPTPKVKSMAGKYARPELV
jgi:hypothetical protein